MLYCPRVRPILFVSWKTGTDARAIQLDRVGTRETKTAGCDSDSGVRFRFRFRFAGAPPRARHCATRVDEGFRARRIYYIAFEFVRDATRTRRTRREPVDESFVARARIIAAQPPRRGTALEGGKPANHDSPWDDDTHDHGCVIDDDVGAGAKRCPRDVVATARMRPRDAKRFVSFVRRE